MPLYAYRCPICDVIQEVNLKMEEVLKTRVYCNFCSRESGGKIQMNKLISGNIGIRFNGKGFYSTDNRVEKIPRKVKEWQ
jgi:putative FmdB family regulatory protein